MNDKWRVVLAVTYDVSEGLRRTEPDHRAKLRRNDAKSQSYDAKFKNAKRNGEVTMRSSFSLNALHRNFANLASLADALIRGREST